MRLPVFEPRTKYVQGIRKIVASVFIMGRRQAELDKAVAEIGGEAYAVSGDVSKPADLDRLYSEVAAKKGKLGSAHETENKAR
jgi:NAD(P)-dependent dehydrogenase (short-subunit alcohol dehydrogenase family)